MRNDEAVKWIKFLIINKEQKIDTLKGKLKLQPIEIIKTTKYGKPSKQKSYHWWSK